MSAGLPVFLCEARPVFPILPQTLIAPIAYFTLHSAGCGGQCVPGVPQGFQNGGQACATRNGHGECGSGALPVLPFAGPAGALLSMPFHKCYAGELHFLQRSCLYIINYIILVTAKVLNNHWWGNSGKHYVFELWVSLFAPDDIQQKVLFASFHTLLYISAVVLFIAHGVTATFEWLTFTHKHKKLQVSMGPASPPEAEAPASEAPSQDAAWGILRLIRDA